MANVFIDSNLWVYGFIETRNNEEKDKRDKIILLLERENNKNNIIISVQVINEFHWILKRKYDVNESEIRNKVINAILLIAEVTSVDLKIYKSAFVIRDKYAISFWDSLIVASALENDCSILYSEDMQDGQVIEEKLKIINPFL
ncbi:MAG TPA: PIN domain-containing protein [Thermodesulfovibrionia bacterium]|nr:PIN domain-containing protein [Thermodesulfovibrionia bacterium]